MSHVLLTLRHIKGIKLLGFKDRSEPLFEDNIKHSTFIYPDEFVCYLSSPHICYDTNHNYRRIRVANEPSALC